MKAGKGWWANKQAFQLGFKCFNLFTVKRLYVTGEFNYARPYTYQRRSTLTNYAHYNQPLAHPLGANFYEILGIADYSYARFSLMAKVIYAEVGYDPRDSAGNYINMGQHVALDYLTHPNENGNWVGQGIRTNQLFTEIQLAYLVNPAYNLRIEAGAISRQTSNFMGKNNTLLLYAGLRTTLSNRYFDF